MKIGQLVVGCLLALGLVGCGGCSPLYVLEGALVQGRILLSREPLPRVLADENLPEAKRAKLALVQEARAFARDVLLLEVGDAYGTYAEVPDGALVWVVSAARQTRLESYTWWFPVVGNVTYKGFFKKSDAEALARSLQEDGWDTYVRPSSAFSTLGWFDDPVLSSWLTRDDVLLVDLVLHELVHRSYYRSGYTDFNESFATWVGRTGTSEFFSQRDGKESPNARLAEKRLEAAFVGSEQWTERMEVLRAFYRAAERAEWPLAEVLARRREAFRAFGDPDKINNALILARWAYRRDLRDFSCARQASGGSLAGTVQETWSRALSADDPFVAIRCQGGTD